MRALQVWVSVRGAVVPPPHGGREEAFGWFPVSPGGLVHLVRMEKEGGRRRGARGRNVSPGDPRFLGKENGGAGGVESRLRQSLPGPGLVRPCGLRPTGQTSLTCSSQYNGFCPTTGNKCFVCTPSKVPSATPLLSDMIICLLSMYRQLVFKVPSERKGAGSALLPDSCHQSLQHLPGVARLPPGFEAWRSIPWVGILPSPFQTPPTLCAEAAAVRSGSLACPSSSHL